jgi:hypothetical protein
VNEDNTRKWEKYKEDLLQTESNLKEFVKSTKVDIMVPMGKKALVRGQLIHTNEVTVCHGSSYFSDCSQAQAIETIQHRLKQCEERLKALKVEKSFFTNKLNVPMQTNAFAGDESECKEIIEESTAEKEDEYKKLNRNLWKLRREKGLSDVHSGPKDSVEIVDEELFARLEELELMEELNEELEKIEESSDDTHIKLMKGEILDPHSRMWVSAADQKDDGEEILDNDVFSTESPSSNQENSKNSEVVDLLKNYRSKIGSILKTIKKNDNKMLSLFLDLSELKDDIGDDINKLDDEGKFESSESEEESEQELEKNDQSNDTKEITKSGDKIGDDISSEGEGDDSDDNTRELISELQEAQIKAPKRKVSFSSSLEDIKIIESNGMPVEHSEKNTIHIHFQHSDQFFNDTIYEDDNDLVQHPGDIYRKFKHLFNSSTTKKSILKNKDQIRFVQDSKAEIVPVKKVFETFVSIQKTQNNFKRLKNHSIPDDR